jgi:hypothetical protein
MLRRLRAPSEAKAFPLPPGEVGAERRVRVLKYGVNPFLASS